MRFQSINSVATLLPVSVALLLCSIHATVALAQGPVRIGPQIAVAGDPEWSRADEGGLFGKECVGLSDGRMAYLYAQLYGMVGYLEGGDVHAYVQVLSPEGFPDGDPVLVHDLPGEYEGWLANMPRAICSVSNRFVVSWTRQHSQEETRPEKLRVFDADGTPAGPEHLTAPGLELVVMDDTKYLTAWMDTSLSSERYATFLQYSDATGNPIGTKTEIITDSETHRYRLAKPTLLTNGQIAVVWQINTNSTQPTRGGYGAAYNRLVT